MEQANAAIPQVRKKKTKQKHHPVLAVLLLIICLTAGFTVYKTYTSHEEKWQTAYSEFLPLFAEEPEKYIVQGEGFDAGTYQVCDVNGDGIPELFINILRDENHYFGTSESVNLIVSCDSEGELKAVSTGEYVYKVIPEKRELLLGYYTENNRYILIKSWDDIERNMTAIEYGNPADIDEILCVDIEGELPIDPVSYEEENSIEFFGTDQQQYQPFDTDPVKDYEAS